MRTILITAIGGDIAQGVAKVIRMARPEDRLVGVDMDDRHGGTLFVDRFQKIPAASSPEYLPALQRIIRETAVDTVIPISEAELAVLQPPPIGAGPIAWITSGADVVATGLDKLQTARTLKGFGLAAPWTVPAQDPPPAYPCLFKKRRGSGSRHVFVVHRREDAEALSRLLPEGIFQELLEPAEQEVTCAVYRTRDARTGVLQLRRRLAGGFTMWAEVMDDLSIRQLCELIASRLNLKGSMNIQLRLTSSGPRVFEINPRFSSTAVMRHYLGFSDVVWPLEELEGKRIQFPVVPVGQKVVRIQDARILEAACECA